MKPVISLAGAPLDLTARLIGHTLSIIFAKDHTAALDKRANEIKTLTRSIERASASLAEARAEAEAAAAAEDEHEDELEDHDDGPTDPADPATATRDAVAVAQEALTGAQAALVAAEEAHAASEPQLVRTVLAVGFGLHDPTRARAMANFGLPVLGAVLATTEAGRAELAAAEEKAAAEDVDELTLADTTLLGLLTCRRWLASENLPEVCVVVDDETPATWAKKAPKVPDEKADDGTAAAEAPPGWAGIAGALTMQQVALYKHYTWLAQTQVYTLPAPVPAKDLDLAHYRHLLSSVPEAQTTVPVVLHALVDHVARTIAVEEDTLREADAVGFVRDKIAREVDALRALTTTHAGATTGGNARASALGVAEIERSEASLRGEKVIPRVVPELAHGLARLHGVGAGVALTGRAAEAAAREAELQRESATGPQAQAARHTGAGNSLAHLTRASRALTPGPKEQMDVDDTTLVKLHVAPGDRIECVIRASTADGWTTYLRPDGSLDVFAVEQHMAALAARVPVPKDLDTAGVNELHAVETVRETLARQACLTNPGEITGGDVAIHLALAQATARWPARVQSAHTTSVMGRRFLERMDPIATGALLANAMAARPDAQAFFDPDLDATVVSCYVGNVDRPWSYRPATKPTAAAVLKSALAGEMGGGTPGQVVYEVPEHLSQLEMHEKRWVVDTPTGAVLSQASPTSDVKLTIAGAEDGIVLSVPYVEAVVVAAEGEGEATGEADGEAAPTPTPAVATTPAPLPGSDLTLSLPTGSLLTFEREGGVSCTSATGLKVHLEQDGTVSIHQPKPYESEKVKSKLPKNAFTMTERVRSVLSNGSVVVGHGTDAGTDVLYPDGNVVRRSQVGDRWVGVNLAGERWGTLGALMPEKVIEEEVDEGEKEDGEEGEQEAPLAPAAPAAPLASGGDGEEEEEPTRPPTPPTHPCVPATALLSASGAQAPGRSLPTRRHPPRPPAA